MFTQQSTIALAQAGFFDGAEEVEVLFRREPLDGRSGKSSLVPRYDEVDGDTLSTCPNETIFKIRLVREARDTARDSINGDDLEQVDDGTHELPSLPFASILNALSYNVVYSPLLYIQHQRYASPMNDYLQTQVGMRIKDLRAAEGTSQERFANRIGMDRTYLASIEAGHRNVTLQNLAKIANGFNLTLAEFFEGVTTKDPQA